MRYGLHFFNFKVSLFILIIIIVGFHMNVMGDVLSILKGIVMDMMCHVGRWSCLVEVEVREKRPIN